MATDTSGKTDKTENPGAEPEAAPTDEEKAPSGEQTAGKNADTEKDPGDGPGEPTSAAEPGSGETPEAGADVPVAAAPRSGGFAAGAAAVVAAGLGLVSLSGSSLGGMMRERKQLIGQIESSIPTGGGGDQIDALYGAPWHQTAAVNGFFALLAVVIGGVLLASVAKKAETRSWVKSVALGGVILGVVGLAVAAGMYFDLLAAPPSLPGAPS